jgi:hypothetical protein
MASNRSWRLGLAFALATSAPSSAATLTVTSTADFGDGSLRKAIEDSNTSPTIDTIDFAIPGPNPQVIAPATSLPAITDRVLTHANSALAVLGVSGGLAIRYDQPSYTSVHVILDVNGYFQ